MVLLAHSGKQHSYLLAKELLKNNLLSRFYTSSYVRNNKIQELSINNLDSFFSRRFIYGLGNGFVDSNWLLEFPELFFRFLLGKTKFVNDVVFFRDWLFDNLLSGRIGDESFDIFWGFQGSCLETMRICNSLGKITVCELATGHVDAANYILNEEKQLCPEWSDSIDNLYFPGYYENRLYSEPREAKFVIVASEFSKNTLIRDNIPEKKIIKLHLACDLSKIKNTINVSQNKKLNVLYAGTVTQRKGVKYLLEAILKLKGFNINLHIIGSVHGSGNALSRYVGSFTYQPLVYQNFLFDSYSEHDVLVLPTLFDGFGLVIIEALAAGLPVITTANSIGPDVIVDDVNGYIVPIRSAEAIMDKLIILSNKSNDERICMRRNAVKSAQNFSLTKYSENLVNVLRFIKNESK